MGQVTIYLNDESFEQRLKSAAAAAHMPVSRWIAKLVKDKTRTRGRIRCGNYPAPGATFRKPRRYDETPPRMCRGNRFSSFSTSC